MADNKDVLQVIREAGYEAVAYTPTEEDSRKAGYLLDAQKKTLAGLSGTLPKVHLDFTPSGRWDDTEDSLLLLTLDEFQRVPDGATLVCIDGSTGVKGTDYIDDDTRFGCIAWGFKKSQLETADG